MKCSKMVAIVLCGALALAMTGCKYDDAAEGMDIASGEGVTTLDGTAGGADVNTVGGANVGTDIGGISGDDGVPATGVPFDQIYKRCTDVNFAPVYFGFDASNLPGGEMAKIEEVAKHLQANPNRVVIVEGNCDERGSNEYNLSLGELRAISIRDYLVVLGVAADRIQTKSYGEEKPAVVGADESAWSKNRRGEFAIYQK